MTSGGSRSEMSCRGFAERGRPPLLTTARASIESVSSGSSLYSDGLITCASTRFMSEPKVGRETGLLTMIGLSHAKDVANCATLRVPNNYEATAQASVTDSPAFAVVLPRVIDLNGGAFEHEYGVVEVKPSIPQRSIALGRIVGDAH